MKYVAYARKHEARFKGVGLFKLALDLAEMLDDQALTIDLSKGDSYSWTNLAEMREPIFEDFCTICCHAGAPVPLLEQGLYKVHLPTKEDDEDKESKKALEEARKIKQSVEKQLNGNCASEATVCRAMALTLQIFPKCGGYSGIEKKQLIAVINDSLISLGLEPIRPNYKDREVKSSTSFQGPQKKTKVLVFDDQLDEIIKTKRALAGWSNLEVEYLIYKRPRGAHSLSEEEKEAELERAAKEILKLKPQIVLMDQGLGTIDGHEVILKIKELAEAPPVFVGNTGGSGEELDEVGAIGNCDKGRKLDCVKKALYYTN